MHTQKKKLIPSQSANKIHKKILEILKKTVGMNISSPLHHDFKKAYNQFLNLFHQYQREVLIHNKFKKISCTNGCSYCCYHWVEDVNSFEGEIISSYIKHHFPEKIDHIIHVFKNDERELNILNEIVEKKLYEQQLNREITDIDSIDLLLASYYQLKRPCALLTDKKACSIYSVRPLTCRIYVSFSSPKRCRPEHIISNNIPTYLLDIEESANKILDTLHIKFNRYNKTGLRSLLIDYLTE
ncbi:MAG: YkgJ family cysteine cluster protein [Chitinispirillia bacterium]|jgi:hypothetical protein